MVPREPEFADRSLRDIFAAVAERSPAPGGGSSAAWAGALGAGLVEMSARFGPGASESEPDRQRLESLADRGADLRHRLLDLAEEDLDSYRPVLAARRLPGDDPERASQLDAALEQASQVPLEVARLAAEVAALGAEAAEIGGADIRGDAIAGVLLAEAAARSAASLVELNLAGHRAEARADEARAAAELAERARRQVLEHDR